MERIKIQALTREGVGKERAKKIRRLGEIPAIVYGKKNNFAVRILPPSVKTLKSVRFSRSSIVDIEITQDQRKETISALIKDLQYHPLNEEIIHIDFMQVSLTEKIKVSVPLVLKGEAKGIKDEGTVEQILWSLELEGLPLDIPKKIEVEVTNLGIGDSIHVGDIKAPDNLRVVSDPKGTIVTVVEKIKEEEVVATAVEGAPEGPEVIKEKKEAEEGEEGEEAEGKEKKETKEPKKEAKEEKEVKGKEKTKE